MMRQPDPRPRAATAMDADALVIAALDALDALQPLIADETALLRDGKVAAALDLAERKSAEALRYQRALQDIKANAIALGRHAPASLALLRQRHEQFSGLMALNMAVLSTARTVSESLVRELAVDVGQARSPQGYGAYGQRVGGYGAPPAPLAVSKSM
jgi:hypothetical protein